jgi:hypothetical protein
VRSLFDAGQEQFPHAAADEFAHWIDPAIPTVEVPNHTDALRVRCPYCEINASSIADGAHMRAELVVNPPMLSFGEEMQIDFAHDWPVLIGIACQDGRSVPSSNSDLVWDIPRCVPDSRAKETVLLNLLRWDRFFRMLIQHDLYLAGIGPKDTNLQIVSDPMRAQHSKRI